MRLVAPSPRDGRRPRAASAGSAVSVALALATVVALGLSVAGCSNGGAERSSPQVFDLDAPAELDLVTPVDATGVVMSEADLETALSDLLAQHAELVAAVMVGAADGTDTDEAVERLQQNTVGLTQAIGLVYGPDGAAAFDQLWSQHTQFFADYAAAAGAGDDEARSEAAHKLHDYHLDFASFAATATGGAAPGDIVADLLHAHVADLTGFINAHVAGDRVEEQARLDAATTYMAVIADALAGAISQQNPERFPA